MYYTFESDGVFIFFNQLSKEKIAYVRDHFFVTFLGNAASTIRYAGKRCLNDKRH